MAGQIRYAPMKITGIFHPSLQYPTTAHQLKTGRSIRFFGILRRIPCLVLKNVVVEIIFLT